MKIVIATPLYPPDLAEPAPYVKELSIRMRKTHRITIATYANIPEKVSGVDIVSTSKQRPLPVRLMFYTLLLLRASHRANVLYAQSGSSVGLPIIIVHVLTHTPLVVHFFEDEAWERATEKHATEKTLGDFLAKPEGTLKIRFILQLQNLLLRCADTVIVPDSSTAELVAKHYRVRSNRITVIAKPQIRPEVLPFTETPRADFDAYEQSWSKHIHSLENILDHAS